MLYELWYWCFQRGEWAISGLPEMFDFYRAAAAAEELAARSGRVVRVVDGYTGEVLHQTGTVMYSPSALVWS